MSIATQINRIKGNVADAYDACEAMGAALPVNQNSANLADTISHIAALSFEVVQSKPVENIKTNVIYLVPKADADTDNVYDEWIYVNGAWELIGSTAVDLSGYYTAEEVDDAINDAIDESVPDVSEKMDLAIDGYPDRFDNKGQMFYTDNTIGVKTSIAGAQSAYMQSYTTGYIDELIGINTPNVAGLQVDFANKVFTRLAGAVNRDPGLHFDQFPMYGGRRRCNVADDGTINAYYGDAGYTEDGSNGQVMVYQPVFWYKVVPLKLEKNADGLGFHIRKANYYVCGVPKAGFKRHPLFYDENGNAVEYVLLSAYEGSMYDASASAYVNDSVDEISYAAGDTLCSVAGKKPISGKLTGVGTKAQLETMASNRGSGWHLNTVKAESANQLLMLIELGTFNTQSVIGQGVVSCPNNDSYNCSCYTGATAALGNATGMAAETIYEAAGEETVCTVNGKLSVTYRGVENPWGNIWKHTNGINLWGDGTMGGGQVYIADDFNFNESKHDDNYRSAGFTLPNSNGYVSAFGYGDENYDWLFIPSECSGNSTLPVSDYSYASADLNEYRIAIFGGFWNNSAYAGNFCWNCNNNPGFRRYAAGGRLLYVPTAVV